MARRRVRHLQRGLARRLSGALYNDNTKTELFELRTSYRRRCRAQRSTLTLTAATVFSNVTERATCLARSISIKIRTLNLTTDYRLQDNFGGTNYLTVLWRQGLDISRRLA